MRLCNTLAAQLKRLPEQREARVCKPSPEKCQSNLYFLTVGHGIQSSACLGNYVIFEVSKPALQYYILYYYIWLAVGIAATITYASSIKQRNRRSALRWLGVGYAVFIIPTIAANLIDPNTIQAIPSIMCGFAVLLAAILLFIITPRICSPRKSKKSV